MFELIAMFRKMPALTVGMVITLLCVVTFAVGFVDTADGVFYGMFAVAFVPLLIGVFVQIKYFGGLNH